MPIFSSKLELSTAASASKIVLADIDLIKGAFKVYPSLSSIRSESVNYFSDTQIVMAADTSRLYQADVVPPDFITIFDYSASFTEFSFAGLSADVPAGTISGSSQIAAFGYVLSSQTSSFAIKTQISGAFTEVSGGLAGRITTLEGTSGGSTDISALNTFTGSAQTSLNALNSATSSYALKTQISGAFTQDSSSISTRLTSLEAGGGSVPAGTVSSSTQTIANLVGTNIVSSSAQTIANLNGSGILSGSSSVPAGTISGSQQITNLGFVNQSQTSSMSVATASYISPTFISASAAASGFGSGGGTTDISALNTFTSSIQSEVNALKAATSSYVTSTQTSSFVTNSQTSSFALKTQISGAFTQDSASISTRLTSLEAGGGSVPAGTVSSSTQILGYNIFATTGSNTFNGTEIVSGSLNVSGSLIANGLTYPTQDGIFESQVLQTNAAGTLSFGDITTIYETIYNGEATALEKGTPVYVSGSQGASPIVFRADAGNPSKMPVTYVVSEEIQPATDGRGIVLGLISGIDLTGYTAGQDVYVAVGGGWTSTRPTGSAIIQLLGVITKPGNGGQGLVLNPGAVTLPNLTAGSVWVGNNNAVPTATSTASLNVLSAQTASYVSPTFISASAAASGFGSATLPSGVVSSSAQVVAALPAGTVSSSAQVSYSGITGVPSGIVSSSAQIIAALPAGTVSSSAQILPILTSSITNFNTEVSRSAAAAGFGSGGGASIPAGTVSSSAQTVANLVGQNVVVNTITAQQYVVSSSVSFITTSFSSGSTAFGDSISDTHIFTGSVSITGSLNIGGPFTVNNENLNVSSGSIILTNSSSIVVLDSGIISGTFVGNLNYNYITNLPNLISSSAQIAALGAGLLSSSAQIASQISGAFTSLSSSFASRITALEGAGGGSGIFTLTGSFYSTTNNIQITGSLSVGSGSFKSFEVDSNGFVVLGGITKDLNTAPVGTIAYSGSDFYLIS